MKKLLVVVLAAVMILAMTTGCGSKPVPEEEPAVKAVEVARESVEGAEGWPAEKLPQGFPVYPEGKVADVDGEMDGEGIVIEISGTNEATYGTYLNTLESDGWTSSFMEDYGLTYLQKDSFMMLTGFDEDTFIMYLIDFGYEFDVQEWPIGDLPMGFPVYPGGIVTYVSAFDDDLDLDDDLGLDDLDLDDMDLDDDDLDLDLDDDDSVEADFIYLEISETDEETFNAYLEILEEAGWKETANEDGLIIEMEKDNYWLMIEFFSNFDMVGLGVKDMGTSDSEDWPTDLPYDLPEYTDGSASVLIGADHVTIVIVRTSPAAFEEYVESMTKAGWTVTSKDDLDGDLVYLLDYKDGEWTCTINLRDTGSVTIIITPVTE